MHQPAHAAQRRGSRPCQVCPGRVRGKRSLEPLPPPVGTRAFVDPSGSHGGRRCAGRQAGRMTSAPAVGSPAPIDAGGRPGEAITNDPIRAAANERSPPTKPEPPKQRARRQHARGMGHPDQLAAPERAKLSPTGHAPGRDRLPGGHPGLRMLCVDKDRSICARGEPATFCYRVPRGCVRMVKLMEDGRRQVTEFLLPGDLLGLDTF